MNKKQLITFENKVAELFKQGKINCPIHLSGGNEDTLIGIFKHVKKEDYVFSTHRNHYHYLLKGGKPKKLLDEILGKETGCCEGRGRSMHIYDKDLKFYTSAIVAGNCAIACGVAMALKLKKDTTTMVYCFVGDGAVDSGHFREAVNYASKKRLSILFIIEDNDLAVETSKEKRWGCGYEKRHVTYEYKRTVPHVGVGKYVNI